MFSGEAILLTNTFPGAFYAFLRLTSPPLRASKPKSVAMNHNFALYKANPRFLEKLE
jgi:hypothetical protein